MTEDIRTVAQRIVERARFYQKDPEARLTITRGVNGPENSRWEACLERAARELLGSDFEWRIGGVIGGESVFEICRKRDARGEEDEE